MDTYLFPIEDIGLGLAVLALSLLVRHVRGRREAALQRAVVRRRSATSRDAG